MGLDEDSSKREKVSQVRPAMMFGLETVALTERLEAELEVTV